MPPIVNSDKGHLKVGMNAGREGAEGNGALDLRGSFFWRVGLDLG